MCGSFRSDCLSDTILLERSQQAYNQIDNRENEADWKHETVGAAAGFGAVKLFEDRQRKEGEPVNHEVNTNACSQHVSRKTEYSHHPSVRQRVHRCLRRLGS